MSAVCAAALTSAVIAAPAMATPDCGSVTYPATGTVGTVQVWAGELNCAAARQVILRYLNDESLVGSGNTVTKQFDGWLCASPTAVATIEYGYSTGCSRESDGARVVVVPR